MSAGNAVETPGPRHVVIDPFQQQAFANVGWDLLRSAALRRDLRHCVETRTAHSLVIVRRRLQYRDSCWGAFAVAVAALCVWRPQVARIRDTDFSSNYFPGVILMGVVGGSSLIAATALLKRSDGRQLASIVAGNVMVFWIIGEVASIRGFHFLQVIYFVTGVLVLVWTPSGTDRVPLGDEVPVLSAPTGER